MGIVQFGISEAERGFLVGKRRFATSSAGSWEYDSKLGAIWKRTGREDTSLQIGILLSE